MIVVLNFCQMIYQLTHNLAQMCTTHLPSSFVYVLGNDDYFMVLCFINEFLQFKYFIVF